MNNILKYQEAGTMVYHPCDSNKSDTTACALFANDQLRNLGYKAQGDAWSRTGRVIYNGYANTQLQGETVEDKLKHGRAAAQDVYDNFDSNTLNKKKLYTVNMYYLGSPYIEEAYADTDKNGILGTHTGNLYWDSNQNKWMVEHNIHGTIYHEPFISLLRANGPYGITAIQLPRKKLFGLFESGGKLNYLNYIQ